jgi:hypothetical protein
MYDANDFLKRIAAAEKASHRGVDQRQGPIFCSVCHGDECRGGGNKKCWQRNAKPSHLGGIVDIYGGIRFVVTHKKDFKHHLREDELLIVVPNLLVHEPIAFGDFPNVMARIVYEVDLWIDHNHPNHPTTVNAIKLYRLRKLEQNQRTHHIPDIVET